MFRSILRPLGAIFLGGVFLLQTGCTVRYVSQRPAPQPIYYPNSDHIEARAVGQVDRIETALRAGRIARNAADVLADNDEMILEMSHRYQSSTYPRRDLTGAETRYLDHLLDDNAEAIEDAIRRRSAWIRHFTRRGPYVFKSDSDRYLYSAYLDHELRQQRERIAEGRRSGRLQAQHAQELEDRIQVIVNRRVHFYRTNNRLHLTEAQIRELDRMTRDNSDCIDYRYKGGKGRWGGDKSVHWKGAERRDRNEDFKRRGWDEGASRTSGKRSDQGLRGDPGKESRELPPLREDEGDRDGDKAWNDRKDDRDPKGPKDRDKEQGNRSDRAKDKKGGKDEGKGRDREKGSAKDKDPGKEDRSRLKSFNARLERCEDRLQKAIKKKDLSPKKAASLGKELIALKRKAQAWAKKNEGGLSEYHMESLTEDLEGIEKGIGKQDK